MKKIFLVFFCLITNFIFAIDISNISNEEWSLNDLQVDMNSSGLAVAMWQKEMPTEDKSIIEFALSDDFGRTWKEPQFLIESMNIRYPKIIINESGEIICLWKKKNDDGKKILEFAKSTDFGKTWTITQLDEINNFRSYEIKNINDSIFILWRDSKSVEIEKRGIYIKKSIDFGRTWKDIKHNVSNDSYAFNCFLHESGQSLISWRDSQYDCDTNTWQKLIYYSISDNFEDDLSEADSFSINTENTIEDIVQSFIDDNGHAIIIWNEIQKEDNGYYSPVLLYSYSSDNGKSWSETVILDKGVPATDFYHTKLAVDPSGSMVFVWQAEAENCYEEGDYIKLVRSSDFGKTWSTPKIISDKSSRCSDPFIYSDSEGHILVTWDEADIEMLVSVKARYSPDFGINWDSIAQLPDKNFHSGDSNGTNTKGNLILLWQQLSKRKVKCQRIISSDLGKSWE